MTSPIFTYTDPYNGIYEFDFFISVYGDTHISIDCKQAGIVFNQPIIDGKIDWERYSSIRSRKDFMSEGAILFAERLVKLMVFM